MRTITYNEKEYSIPTDWNEITLEMQINAEDLIKKMGNELGLIGLISAYTDIPIKAIKEGDVALMNDIHNTLAFIYEGYVPEPITEFEHNGHMYYLKELQDTQFQDFISLQNILSNNKNESLKPLPRIIAVMCKMENETLDDYKIDDRAKEFMTLPLSTAKDCEAFFLTKSQELRLILALSTKDFQEQLLSIKYESAKNSIKEWKEQSGRFSLIRLQAGIYLLTLKYLKRTHMKFFNLQPSKRSTKSIWKMFRKHNQNTKENE